MGEKPISVLALADDMTGALEVGAKFSGAGIHTIVSATPIPAASAQVVVFDTETRHASPETAAAEVKRFVLQSGSTDPKLLYKKTDSTLRGNISAELRALSELFPDWRIGYAPAYPALGRTVRDGVLYVDGVAVEQTAFARDGLNPIRNSSILTMLHPELACTIFDGETDSDLRGAARLILADPSIRIAAGPAGLAEMMAEEIDLFRGATPSLPAIRVCLVMNGSLHERSAIQMRRAEAPGWTVLRKEYAHGADPARVARENGEYLAEQIATHDPDAVFVIGGDTAFALIAALGLPTLSPIAEVVPGVPVTRVERNFLKGRTRDLLLITKAGGFGDPDVILSVRQKLSAHAQ